MQQNLFQFVLVAVLATLPSCQKDRNNVAEEPATLTVEDAKIRLAGQNGGINCIEITGDGTYIAEVESDDSEGASAYLRLPFSHLIAADGIPSVTTYKTGSYSVEENQYIFDGLGVLRFEDKQLYAILTLVNGQSYRCRSGILRENRQSAEYREAPGRYKPKGVYLTGRTGDGENTYEAAFNGIDLEEIIRNLADSFIPELDAYKELFAGYRLRELFITGLNTCLLQFEDAETVGGYWSLLEKSVSRSATIGQEAFQFNATLVPEIAPGSISFQLSITAKRGDQPDDHFEARADFAL